MDYHMSFRQRHIKFVKSYGPYRYAYAERAGTTLELRSGFKVIKHGEMSQSHSMIGKSIFVMKNPEMKGFLQFLMDHSAAFCLCMFSWVSLKSIVYFSYLL